MESLSFQILALLFCFFAAAFFSAAEAALLSIGADRARQLIEEGGAKGKAMAFMILRPSELLATILVGNNIANILSGALTTAITADYTGSPIVGIALGITTMIVIVFGELLPKTLGRTYAEEFSVVVIRSLQVLFYVCYPVIKTLVWFINTILGDSAEYTGRMVTRDDIEFMINKAEKEKTIDSKQIDLLSSILEFPTIKVKDIMIPRTRVNYLQSSWKFEEILEHIKETENSRYPVCSGELENIIGFLHVKDLAFLNEADKNDLKIEKLLKAPFFVYEHMKIQSVFDHMNRKKVHLALVKDENGTVVGIVTLEDIIEEIFGEIHDEHDDVDEIEQHLDAANLVDGIVVDGDISLRELYQDYDIKIPLNDNYSTLAGFILDMLGNTFPEQGQIIVWEGLSFDLIAVDEYVIKEVRIKDVDGEKHFISKKQHAELVEQSDIEATQNLHENERAEK
ncbi:MAG: hemolysin family protein [Bacteriovoracaceae bacterium]|jgi:putative hemolysin|nr:hemolysin family protein [Bacteriovoracaceae bacterium]